MGKIDTIDPPSAAFNATSLFEADRDEGHQARVTRLRSWFSGLGRARIFAWTERAAQFCVMHNTAFFNDVVGCSPRRQGRPMRRREFITLLGGAAAWVSPARAQEPRRVIGFLGSGSSDTFPGALAAFVQGLKDTGFIEGNNISIEWRWAEGQYNRLPSLAGELVSRGVAVIVAFDAPAAFAAKAATKTIPIVFVTGADPVKTGLVDSFSRPGGNLTGVIVLISMLGPKRLELLRELLPSTSTIRVAC